MSPEETLDLEAFAHIVAHDLSAPIRGLSIHLKLLAQEVQQGDAEQAGERMTLLQQRLRRMDEMLRRIRHFSKIHVAGENRPLVDLEALVAEALDTIEADDAHIDCIGRGKVLGPSLLVLAVLQELIRNALEHHDRDARIQIDITDGRLSITDDGPGLPAPPEEMLAVFSTSGGRVLDGGGSGLALSRYIARHLGGELVLMSPVADGRGVRATLLLPVA